MYKCYACGKEIERPGELCPYCKFPVISTMHGEKIEEKQIQEFAEEYRKANPQYFTEKVSAPKKPAESSASKKPAESLASKKPAADTVPNHTAAAVSAAQNTAGSSQAKTESDEAAEWRKKYEELRKEYQKVSAGSNLEKQESVKTKSEKQVNALTTDTQQSAAAVTASSKITPGVIAFICFLVLIIWQGFIVGNELRDTGIFESYDLFGNFHFIFLRVFPIIPLILYIISIVMRKKMIAVTASIIALLYNAYVLFRMLGIAGYPDGYRIQQLMLTAGFLLLLIFSFKKRFATGGILAGCLFYLSFILYFAQTVDVFPSWMNLIFTGFIRTMSYISLGFVFEETAANHSAKGIFFWFITIIIIAAVWFVAFYMFGITHLAITVISACLLIIASIGYIVFSKFLKKKDKAQQMKLQ